MSAQNHERPTPASVNAVDVTSRERQDAKRLASKSTETNNKRYIPRNDLESMAFGFDEDRRPAGASSGTRDLTASTEMVTKMGASVVRSSLRIAMALAIIPLSAANTSAVGAEWNTFTIADTGLSVDVPVSIFTEDAGSTDGMKGRTFFTQDHRADLTIKSMPNSENDLPAAFLAKMQPPTRIQTKGLLPISSPSLAFEMVGRGIIAATKQEVT